MKENIVNCPPCQTTDESVDRIRPHYTVRSVEGAYEVGVVVPGVKREDVSLRFEEGLLHVVARRRAEVPQDWRPLRREIGPVEFRLDLQVNAPVEAGRVSAKLEDGVLSLRLPLREEAQPRDITVE